jgi:hypothetical protein
LIPTTLSDMRHSISVQAFDGTRYWDNARVGFDVNNHGVGMAIISGDILPWLTVVLAVCIVLGLVLFVAVWRKRPA